MKTQRTRFTALGVPKLPEGRHTDGTGLYLASGQSAHMVHHGTRHRRASSRPLAGDGHRQGARGAGSRHRAQRRGLSPTPSARPLLLDAPANVLTIGDLLDRYEQMRRRKGGKGMKSLDEASRTLRNNLGGLSQAPGRCLQQD